MERLDMQNYLVIKIPVKIPTDLINAKSTDLSSGTVDYLKSVMDGSAKISFETVTPDDTETIKDHLIELKEEFRLLKSI